MLQLSGCRVSGTGTCKSGSPSIPVREFTDCDDQLFIGTVLLPGGVFAYDVNSANLWQEQAPNRPSTSDCSLSVLYARECQERDQKATGLGEFRCGQIRLHHFVESKKLRSKTLHSRSLTVFIWFRIGPSAEPMTRTFGLHCSPLSERTQMKLPFYVAVPRVDTSLASVEHWAERH